MTNKYKILSPNQITFFLVVLFIGPGFLVLPNAIIRPAMQDAWISAVIGLIYPAYIIIISNYIVLKFPDLDILDINKKFFGKSIGTLLNITFFVQFIITLFSVFSSLIRIIQENLAVFLNPLKISVLFFLISLYVSSKGLKTLAKLNEFFSYFLIIAVCFSFFALKDSSFYNILPTFGSGFENIIKSSFKTLYTYTGFELILVIHPYAKDINKISSSSLRAFFICSFIWVWSVLISILYLGPDIVPKTYWAFLFVFGSINIAVTNNFRYVFLIIWTVIGLKMLANYTFLSSKMLSNITNFKFQNLNFFIALLNFFLSYLFPHAFIQNLIANVIIPLFIGFNIILLTTLAIFASRIKAPSTAI